ncbi:MAG: stage V sporulation protein T [Anaeromicrobium sp.]|uniref:stage V sporulation protein T n=1 Tax=Anaeromicrobium sp. TaxID=1929132 RepID=UPI0025D2C632|nr:stage V sporulation protein T [Anaeromicrobium sp.]MCT4594045.1 stage V sporulation protein T [Anaeromicrobium sp.]
MKATGIVRRIDDLGRVVIPKEIRRTLRIREGDPLEIFTDRDGEVILKKYSPIGELSEFATEYAEALSDSLGCMAMVADRDTIISIAGGSKKEFLEKRVSKAFERIMEDRKPVLSIEKEKVYPLTSDFSDEQKYSSQIIAPIITQGDSIGAVVLMSKDEDKELGEIELKTAETAASFLGKQMEQ